MAQKNISIKNHNKKHHREIMRGALFLYMSTIFSSCSWLRNFGPSRQIRISRSILFSLRDLSKGDTIRFMTEKPHPTPQVDGGISNVNLKSFILFGKLWTELSEHIFEYTSLSVGLIVFKYSGISFCLISPLRTFC